MANVTDRRELPKKFNPQNTSKEVLKATFAVRLKEYQRLWNQISTAKMEHPEQHYIIQGVRGAGKTTLLTRLAIAVAEDAALSGWLVPVQFREEEYGVHSLFSLCLRIAQDLEENPAVSMHFLGLVDALEAINAPTEGEECKAAFKVLDQWLDRAGKKLILFVDNMVEMLDAFSVLEKAILREQLSQNQRLRVFGGSAVALEAFYDHKEAFYQFFRVVNLGQLDSADTIALLRSLAAAAGVAQQEKIETVLREEPQKIEAMRRLTGGVPRTIALLFEILAEGPRGSTFEYLDHTLDMVSPMYKHRMDDLSPQQKPIVHAIAMHWDAISAGEIAERTRISSKNVSAQLAQLQKLWIVEKVPTDTKNHLYRLQERFFNIWYLMRYGRRRDKNRMRWLAHFLEVWCSREELVQRVSGYAAELARVNYLPGVVPFTSALMGCSHLGVAEKAALYRQARRYLQDRDDGLLCDLPDLTGEESLSAGMQFYDDGEFDEAIHCFEVAQRQQVSGVYACMGMALDALGESSRAEQTFLAGIKQGENFCYWWLGRLYETALKDQNKAMATYQEGGEKGDPTCYSALGHIYLFELEAFENAEAMFRKAIEGGDANGYWGLGVLFWWHLEDFDKTEEYFLQGIDAGDRSCAFSLARMYVDLAMTDKKADALRLVVKVVSEKEMSSYLVVLVQAALWNDELDMAFAAFDKLLKDFDDLEQGEFDKNLIQPMLLFLAKGQTNVVDKWFQEFDLKDRFKPVYFVLMSLMRDKYTNEILRMGPEFEETVTEMLARIEELKIKYA